MAKQRSARSDAEVVTCPICPPPSGCSATSASMQWAKVLPDGIFDHEAKGDEFRTTPLWGLRFKKLFLHDGRVSTIVDAVTAHGGEASAAVTAYRNASSE